MDRTPQPRLSTYLFFALVSGLVVFLSHITLLQLPYFWDELGQFVPGALDLLREGRWIPRSTTANSHPPGVTAYLALVWWAFGYSITATRTAMLLLASAAVLAVFLLAIQLCREVKGAPAYSAVLLFLACPLFYSQSMLAQLDMPAMLFTTVGLLCFLQGRYAASVIACAAAVTMKETALVAPLVFSAFLLSERKYREAVLFLAPALLVGAWLLYVTTATGHWFGAAEYTRYNLTYPLHPARLSAALLRRAWYLFAANFHWIGSGAILYAWRRSAIFWTRQWGVAAAYFATNALIVTILGGAALERYLLPALPVFYIAVAAAWTALPPLWRNCSQVVMLGGLVGSLFWNPPYPFPFENNLAMVDFVKLQQAAAEYVEHRYANHPVASAWPMSDALRRPEFGYVSRPMQVLGVEDFSRRHVAGTKGSDVFILYSRTWEPAWSVLRLGWAKDFLVRYYSYEPQVTAAEIYQDLKLLPVARWERRGQWIEVYAKDPAIPPITTVVELNLLPPAAVSIL